MNTNLITVIQFSALVGKMAPQIYGSIRNGSFPQEFIVHERKAAGGTQPMIKRDEALEWFKAKEQARLGKAAVSLVYTVDQLLIDLTAGNKKGLATQIQNFIASKN